MEDDPIAKLKSALEKLDTLLSGPIVAQAVEQLGSIIRPIIEILVQLLNLIRDALQEIIDGLEGVGIEEISETVNELLDAAAGLLPGQADRLEEIKSALGFLENVPSVEDLQEVLDLLTSITTKLEAL